MKHTHERQFLWRLRGDCEIHVTSVYFGGFRRTNNEPTNYRWSFNYKELRFLKFLVKELQHEFDEYEIPPWIFQDKWGDIIFSKLGEQDEI